MSRSTLVILGHEVAVDFNDRDLVRGILDLYQRITELGTKRDDGTTNIELAALSLDLIDEADAIVTRTLGQEQRDLLLGAGRKPIKEPVLVLHMLAEGAGSAYDELFGDYAPKGDVLDA